MSMNNECAAAVPIGPYGAIDAWVICRAEVTEVYEYACVHEHVVRKGTCALHRPVPGDVGCRQCADLGHGCPMEYRLAEEVGA